MTYTLVQRDGFEPSHLLEVAIDPGIEPVLHPSTGKMKPIVAVSVVGFEPTAS